MATNYLSLASYTAPTNTVNSIVYGDGSTQLTSSPAMDDTTFGTNWSQNGAPLGTWRCIAGSSTGQYQIAGLLGQGIFLTRNYGQTWTQLTNTTVNGTTGTYPSGTTSASAWFDAAVSSSGKYMTIMTTGTGNLYVSSNYGITWVIASAATAANYQCASMSAAGLYQLATISGGQLQLSINSGTTWSAVATSKNWACCGMSATGQYMTAVASTGGATAAGVFLSSNYGQTWTDLATYTLNSATGAYPAATTSNLDWSACAVSATGQYQVIARTVAPPYTTTLLLYTSSNYGITWTATASTAATSNTWNRMQVSASGQYQVATSVTPSVTTSLLNAYQFDLQDQSGTGVYNQVTGAYDGTLVNGATISSATSKYATGSLSLTAAASQYLQLPNFTMTSAIATTGITFATWMNLNTTQTNYARVFDLSQVSKTGSTTSFTATAATAAYTLTVYYNASTLTFALYSNVNNTQTTVGLYTTSYTPATGTWTHIAWSINSTSWTIYVNGASSGSFTTTPTTGNYLPTAMATSFASGVFPNFYLGRSSYSTDPYTTGNFNDFRMYTTALSAANITTLYNATPNTLAYSTNFGANWSVASIRAADVAISTDGRNLSVPCQGSFGIQQSVAAAPVTTITGTTVMNGVSLVQGQADLGTLTPSTLGQTWTALSGLSSSASWYGSAMSATGQYMVANIAGGAGTLYYSSNYGSTWTQAVAAVGLPINTNYMGVGMSGSGQYVLVGVNSASGVLYSSSTYGASWSAVPTISGTWYRNALSYNGQYQYATSSTNLYYSSNYGASFTISTLGNTTYTSVCCSSNGQYVSTTASGGVIYYSSNYGVSWSTSSSVSGNWQLICCSSTGQYQYAALYGGSIYYSTNYGVTWVQSASGTANWTPIACTSSGQYVIAAAPSNYFYYSTNYGINWTQSSFATGTTQFIAMSQNGLYSLLPTNGGAVYLSVASPATVGLVTNGRVGIGTTAPQATLDVYGSFRATSDLVAQGIYLTPSPANATLIQQYFQKVASTAAPNGVPPFWSSGFNYSIIGGAPGNYAYFGGVLVPDGRVIFPPANTTYIGIFNPYTNIFSSIGGAPGSYAYIGGVLAPDGRVVFVPYSATTIGLFNPTTNTYSTIAGVTGYSGGVLLPDGRVLFVPNGATSIGIFNPTTNTFILGPSATGHQSGALLPDGRVVLAPTNTSNIGLFNPSTNTYSTITGTSGYNGGVLLPDGRVLFVPSGSANVGFFNPITNTFSTFAAGAPGVNAYIGGVLLFDGRVVFVPSNYANVGIFTTSMSAPREMCLSPYCNKY